MLLAYTTTVAELLAFTFAVAIVLGLARWQLVEAAKPSVAPATACLESRSNSCR